MSGVVAGLIASVKAGSAPAPTNLITNGAFTVNDVGWTNYGNGQRDTSVFRSSPASWYTYLSDDYSPKAEYVQNNVLTVGSRYSLSCWVRNPNAAQSITVTMILGTNYVNTNTATLAASTAWQYVKFENQICLGNTNLTISIDSFSVGSDFYLDDVSLVLGATAL
jgi:hypothetical protein